METSTLSSAYRKHVGTAQTTIGATLVPEGNTIGKILCVNAKACVDNVEVLSGEARVSGTVVFEALYTGETGEFYSVTQALPLSEKVEDASLNPAMHPIIKVEVVEVKILDAQSTQIEVSATVEIALDCMVTDEVEQVAAGAENILLNSGTMKCVSVVSSGDKPFTVSEEYDIKANIDKILFYDAQVLLKDVTPGDKFFTVTGEIVVSAIASVTENEVKQLKNISETITFQEDLADENIAADNMVLAYASVNPNNVKVSLVSAANESTPSSVVKMEVTPNIRYLALKEEEKSICLDGYSLTHKINTISDSFQVSSLLKSNHYSEHIDGSIVLDETQPRIAKIVSAYGARATVANTVTSENTITVEGIGYATVVYLTDEDEKLNSAVVEVPFSVKLISDGLTEHDQCFTRVLVKDMDAKTKKGKEINLEMELELITDLYSSTQEVTIKDIELTEEMQPSEYALQIYIAPKNATLWDIAKHLRIQQEIIVKQNPALVYPLEKSESVVYFRS